MYLSALPCARALTPVLLSSIPPSETIFLKHFPTRMEEASGVKAREVIDLFCPDDDEATLWDAAKHPATGDPVIEPVHRGLFECLLCSTEAKPHYVRFHSALAISDVVSHMGGKDHRERVREEKAALARRQQEKGRIRKKQKQSEEGHAPAQAAGKALLGPPLDGTMPGA